MSRSTPKSRPRWRSVVAAFSVAFLIGAGAAPAQADSVLIWDGSTSEFDLTVTSAGGGTYQVEVTNLTSETQHLGFGADLREQGVTEYFWEEEWQEFNQRGQAVVEPGGTHEEDFLPSWSGMTYSFFRAIDSEPELIGEFVVEGRYLPFEVFASEGQASGFWAGYQALTIPNPVRAGEALRVETQLGSDWPLLDAEVWIGPVAGSAAELEHSFARGWVGFSFSTEGSEITDGLQLIGTLPVADGELAGSVPIPGDLLPGDYQLLIGDSSLGLWPAGPPVSISGVLVGNVSIEEGPPRGATGPDTPMPVTPLDQYGATPVSFTFGEVTTEGTTSVTTSTSGPASTAFTLLGGVNAVYYELETTAGFTGLVTVCLSYDPTDLSEAQQNAIALFHYTGGAWSNITTSSSPGQVCGETDSFSPFVLGIPTVQYAFQGFLDPVSNTSVNKEFAGTIVPIRFRLGGDQGMSVIASGSPTSGVTACTVGATPTASQPATAAATLTYVRATGTYWYWWKTDKSWAGTCRQFSLTLADGTVHTATFKFTKLTLGSLLRAIIQAI